MTRAWVIDQHVTRCDGSAQRLKLKAWRNGDGEPLRWQFWRFIDAAGYGIDGGIGDVGARLRTFGSALVEHLCLASFDLELPHFGRSLHSLAHRSATEAELQDGEDDFWCSTGLAVMFLLFFCQYRKGPNNKAICIAALTAFLETTLRAPQGSYFDGISAPEDALCDGTVHEETGFCSHISRVMGCNWPGGSPQRRFVQQLLCLLTEAKKCEHARDVFRTVLDEAAKNIDERTEDWGNPNLERCNFIALGGDNKRRRTDQHLKEVLADKFFKDGRAPSTSSSLKVLYGAQHSDAGRKWEADLLAQHQAAQWLSAATTKSIVLGASFDGTALGHPKKEYLLTNFWNVRGKSMFVAPPVDRTARTQQLA